jgi:hypothetical protein
MQPDGYGPARQEAITTCQGEHTMTEPTNEELEKLIKPIWLKVQPSHEAQRIRSSLSVEFDAHQYPDWVSSYIPDYVWDLVDIAAQRGIDLAGLKEKLSSPENSC